MKEIYSSQFYNSGWEETGIIGNSKVIAGDIKAIWGGSGARNTKAARRENGKAVGDWYRPTSEWFHTITPLLYSYNTPKRHSELLLANRHSILSEVL